jgi:hypothetical protein
MVRDRAEAAVANQILGPNSKGRFPGPLPGDPYPSRDSQPVFRARADAMGNRIALRGARCDHCPRGGRTSLSQETGRWREERLMTDSRMSASTHPNLAVYSVARGSRATSSRYLRCDWWRFAGCGGWRPSTVRRFSNTPSKAASRPIARAPERTATSPRLETSTGGG